MSRRDVIIVASVSAIYGLGSPELYEQQCLILDVGEERDQRAILRRLVELQYERNDEGFVRNKFRVRGDTIEVFPAYEERGVRIQLFGDEIERMSSVDPVTGEIVEELDRFVLFPASHYVTDEDHMQRAIEGIEAELKDRLAWFEEQGKLLEAQRLRMRTTYDLEMLREIGSCSGIENYSRYLDGRDAGQMPYTLLDYFPDDFLCVLDESHVTVPQLHGQYEGDRSRKETLVEHGFRLPSALDNRPLRFEEFIEHVNQVVFMSATPGDVRAREVEAGRRADRAAHRARRPRGDREADQGPDRRPRRRDQRPGRGRAARARHDADEEDVRGPHRLPDRARHPGPVPAQRDRHARAGRDPARRCGSASSTCSSASTCCGRASTFPRCRCVAILDADKEGFLRSDTSLIQTMGRAARNVDGQVVMYADQVTDSMRRAISETNRRRKGQLEYNAEHGIDPQTIRKKVADILEMVRAREGEDDDVARRSRPRPGTRARSQAVGGVRPRGRRRRTSVGRLIQTLQDEMHEAAKDLRFEEAARLRDEIGELKRELREVS